MTVPDYQMLMLPVLRIAAERDETSIRDCIERLAQEIHLSDEDRAELLPSGKQTIFSSRVRWAKTYLVKAGLLEITSRGHFKISPRGREVLSRDPERIDNRFLSQFEEFKEFKKIRHSASEIKERTEPVLVNKKTTPDEQIEAAFEEINVELRSELLHQIIEATPTFFEQVIVDLMIAMGYGGSRAEAGQRVGKSGDGGIDGVINEDTLGLDIIYLQAKRYAPGNSVGVDKVHEFAGALLAHSASKGVLVTTSRFTQSATKYVESIPQRLILIDGDELTRLLVHHGVGVRTARSLELKKLDLDYFEEEIG